MWRNWNSLTLLVEIENGIPLWKTVWQFLKKSNMCLPYDLVILLLDYLAKRNETIQPHKDRTQMFMAALFVTAPNGKQLKYSTGNRTNWATTIQWNTVWQ